MATSGIYAHTPKLLIIYPRPIQSNEKTQFSHSALFSKIAFGFIAQRTFKHGFLRPSKIASLTLLVHHRFHLHVTDQSFLDWELCIILVFTVLLRECWCAPSFSANTSTIRPESDLLPPGHDTRTPGLSIAQIMLLDWKEPREPKAEEKNEREMVAVQGLINNNGGVI